MFGKDVVTGQAIHRILDATGVIEKRRIPHADVYTEGGIFLREELNVVKEVLKYPYFQNCHVLEMLVPYDKLESDEKDELILEDNNYLYECFYAFQDPKGQPLPVNWKIVEYIMHFKLYGKRDKSTGKTEELEKELLDEKQIRYIEEEMQQETLITAPHAGVKGIFVPSKYEKQRYSSGRLRDDSQYVKDTTKPVVASI